MQKLLGKNFNLFSIKEIPSFSVFFMKPSQGRRVFQCNEINSVTAAGHHSFCYVSMALLFSICL